MVNKFLNKMSSKSGSDKTGKYANLSKYYDIRGDGVAELDIDKALMSKDFHVAVRTLLNASGLLEQCQDDVEKHELHSNNNR